MKITAFIVKHQVKVWALCLFFIVPSCKDKDDGDGGETSPELTLGELIDVQTRANTTVSKWDTYKAQTVDYFLDFKGAVEPAKSVYGGWKIWKTNGSGFFRAESKDGRWWIIDPEGYPYIHRAVVALEPGTSENQKAAFTKKFKGNSDWAEKECAMLSKYGFNGAGAWSAVDILRSMNTPFAYTLIVSPMASYKAEHIKKFGGKYEEAGWQGYRYDLVMVFDDEFDKYISYSANKLAQYKNDTCMLGYFTDNELPWVFDALDRHLKYLGKDEAGYIAAKKWFDARKGFNASVSDINDADRTAFSGYYFETYMKKVTTAMRAAAPNHMYLGCRFTEHHQELRNPEIFRVAGKYMDIVSINHYRKWQPEQESLENWENWSGKPFLITEWYIKGEDSGLPNATGAGWNVKTQKERGYFYQNFTLELLKSKGCVGWHWFRYQDNDPADLSTDPSNRDSNKGVITNGYDPYRDLLDQAKKVNEQTYWLIRYFQLKN